jgi:hypothetical protein
VQPLSSRPWCRMLIASALAGALSWIAAQPALAQPAPDQPAQDQPAPAQQAPPQPAPPDPASAPAQPIPSEAQPPPAPPAPPPPLDPYLAGPVEATPAPTDPIGSRLIDVPSPFTVGRRRLELLVTHRFLQPVNQGASAHNLWGLDSGAEVGVGFTYGLLRHLDLSVYRSQFQEDYELAGKLQLLDQSARAPLSLAVRAGADLLGRSGIQDPHRPFAQLLLGRRLRPGWNVFASPTWVRATPTLRNAWNVPFGLAAPLPGHWQLDAEGIAPNHALRSLPGASRFAWHAAFAKQVGWHLFQIVAGNSRATTVDQSIGGDFAGGFATRDVRLGFNLIRYFGL